MTPETPHETVTLLDGRRVTMRVAGPADVEAVDRFFETLLRGSLHTQHTALRYGGNHARRLGLLAHDPSRHAIVASPADRPGTVVGFAAYVHDRDDERADVCLLVDEGWQNRRVGSALLESLVREGRSRGFRQFHTELLGGNVRMLNLLRDFLGADVRSTPEGGYLRIDFSLT